MRTITSLSQISRAEQQSWMGKPYAIDVETEGLLYMEHDLIGVALYVDGEAYYFVRKHTADDGETITTYLSDHDLQVLLNPIMSQKETVASLHNSKYDLHFFERFGLPLLSRNFDTLMAAQLLNENRKNGLKDLTPLVDESIDHAKYADLATYPTFSKDSPYAVPLHDFAEYAMKDVIVTYKLWQKFRKEMPKDVWRGRSIQDVFNTIWMPMIPVLQEMEFHGFKVNVEHAKELHAQYSAQIEKNKDVVQRAGYAMLVDKNPQDIEKYYWKILSDDELEDVYENDDGQQVIDIMGIQTPVMQPTPRSKPRRLYFNIASPLQLVELIIGNIDLPDGVDLTKTPKGGDSVNVDNLTIIKHYLGDETPEYIDHLLEWRKADKFVGTYLDAFMNKTDADDRLHCFFSIAANDVGKGGTRTGRLSSSNINLQNIPSRGIIGSQARELFIAGEGKVLVACDYSNMETVIFTHFSKDPVLLKAFSENLDVHALTACGQHNLDYEHFVSEYKNGNPEYDAMRRTAKTLLFGQAYGMGAMKLQRTLLVQNGQEYSFEQAKRMLQAFNETYSVMSEWKRKVNDFAGTHGFVPTILGRKRRLPLVFSHDRGIRSRAMRQGVNATIQGSCADILFQAMIPIQSAFKAMGGSLIASVHDELIAEVPEQFADAAARTMERLMVDLINPTLNCKLKAEANYGKTWLEAKG